MRKPGMLENPQLIAAWGEVGMGNKMAEHLNGGRHDDG